METKHVVALCFFISAAGGPIVAVAQSIPQLESASSPPASRPRKTDDAQTQNQAHPPIDPATPSGTTSTGSSAETNGTGASMPIQAFPPVDDKPLPKPY